MPLFLSVVREGGEQLQQLEVAVVPEAACAAVKQYKCTNGEISDGRSYSWSPPSGPRAHESHIPNSLEICEEHITLY